MTGRTVRYLLALATAAALTSPAGLVATIPPRPAILAVPVKHRPARGASRDRSLPGKKRRNARRTRP